MSKQSFAAEVIPLVNSCLADLETRPNQIASEDDRLLFGLLREIAKTPEAS